MEEQVAWGGDLGHGSPSPWFATRVYPRSVVFGQERALATRQPSGWGSPSLSQVRTTVTPSGGVPLLPRSRVAGRLGLPAYDRDAPGLAGAKSASASTSSAQPRKCLSGSSAVEPYTAWRSAAAGSTPSPSPRSRAAKRSSAAGPPRIPCPCADRRRFVGNGAMIPSGGGGEVGAGRGGGGAGGPSRGCHTSPACPLGPRGPLAEVVPVGLPERGRDPRVGVARG